MLVSAVVSTYNAQRFIKGRLENLVTQTLYRKGQLEIIVIDSNSQEDERSIVQKFSSKYKNIYYLRTEQRETVYGAWNRGIAVARGCYFINANTDDRFIDDALERLAGVLENQPEFDAVYGDWFYTLTENDSFSSPASKEFYSYPDFYPPLLFYHQLTSHALMIRLETFKEISLFADTMEVCGDRDWVFRLAVSGRKALHLKKPVGLYLKRGDSLERSRSDAANREFGQLLNFYMTPENFIRLYGRTEIPDSKELARLYAKTGSLGKNYLKRAENGVDSLLPQQSLMFLRRALVLDPDNLMAVNNLAVAAAVQGGVEFAQVEMAKLLKKDKIGAIDRARVGQNLSLVLDGARHFRDFFWYS